jgi:hypothetical protein
MQVERITDDRGTAYTAVVQQIEPADHPELEPAGFTSTATLYTLLTSGQVYADYDVHRLARELPGDASWIVPELQEIKE